MQSAKLIVIATLAAFSVACSDDDDASPAKSASADAGPAEAAGSGGSGGSSLPDAADDDGGAGRGGSAGLGGPLGGCGSQKSPFVMFSEAQISTLSARMHDGKGVDDAALVESLETAEQRLTQDNEALLANASIILPIRFQDLALAIHFGDPSRRSLYRDRCADMAQHLVEQRDPKSYADNGVQDNPHVMYALTLAYDTCLTGEPASSPAKVELAQEIEKYLQFTLDDADFEKMKAYGNYAPNVGAMLILGALSLDADGVTSPLHAEALERGDELVRGVIQNTFTEDGAYHEGVLYSAVTLHALSYAAVARYNFDCTDYFADPRLERSLDWLAYNVLPQGEGRVHGWNDTNSFNNPFRAWHAFPTYALSRFGTWASRFVHDTLVADAGLSAAWLALFATDVPLTEPTLPDAKLFDNGQYFQRTGWAVPSGDLHVTFYSGPFFGGHNQEDKNNFTLHGYGSRLLVDTGDSKGPGACADPGSRTEGHNLIVVDVPGDGMGFLGQAKASGSCGTDGKISSSLLSPVADYLHGDARSAYVENSPLNPWPDWQWCAYSYNGGTNGAPDCSHPKAMERANRHFLVFKSGDGLPEYIAFSDDTRLDSSSANKYRLALHAEKKAANAATSWAEAYEWSTSSVPFELTPEAGQTAQGRLDALWMSPQGASLSVQTYAVDNYDGDNRTLLATITAAEPLWFVALFPFDSAVPRPAASVLAAASGAAGKLAFAGGTTDHLYAGRAGSGVLSTAQASGVLRIGVVRERPLPDRYALGGATQLTHEGTSIAKITAGPANLASDGTTLFVSDPSATYDVFGPGLVSALHDGKPLPIYRAGDRALVTPSPVPACSASGGKSCGAGQSCSTELVFASDSTSCCVGGCS